MSVESALCRTLDIRFIDAKRLVNEAKMSLDISGYVRPEQRPDVQAQAFKIFEKLNEDEKQTMKKANWDLESVKIATGSQSSSGWMDAGGDLNISEHSFASTSTGSVDGSTRKRGLLKRR